MSETFDRLTTPIGTPITYTRTTGEVRQCIFAGRRKDGRVIVEIPGDTAVYTLPMGTEIRCRPVTVTRWCVINTKNTTIAIAVGAVYREREPAESVWRTLAPALRDDHAVACITWEQ